MQKEKILAVIPARGGSTRIVGKNFKKFNGKPIIAHTIKILKKSEIFDKIIVSTDSEKIASIAKKYGAEVPFLRPKSLANNIITTRPSIKHCINYLEKKGLKFDFVCEVFAPNPFLTISDLKRGLKKIKAQKTDYVFSATAYIFPFFRSFTYSKKKGLNVIFKKNIKKRSQDLDRIMCDAGQFYWAHKNTWIGKSKSNFTKGSSIIEIPLTRYHDLDTPQDWKRAELFSKIIKKN